MLKKIFVLIIAIMFCGCAFAADDLTKSIAHIQQVVGRLSRNFRQDANMARFLSQDFFQYQFGRMMEKDVIFPRVNNLVKGYNKEYPQLSADYVLALDKEYMAHLRKFTDTYCKYNDKKFKDPDTCSRERMEAMFAQ
jgi:hypothetical protein